MEASGSNFKIIKGAVVTQTGKFRKETRFPITSSGDKVLIAEYEVDRIQLLEAIGLTPQDLDRVRGKANKGAQ